MENVNGDTFLLTTLVWFPFLIAIAREEFADTEQLHMKRGCSVLAQEETE